LFLLFQRHSITGSMSAAKPLSSLSDKRPSYTDITMPGESVVTATIYSHPTCAVRGQSSVLLNEGHTQGTPESPPLYVDFMFELIKTLEWMIRGKR